MKNKIFKLITLSLCLVMLLSLVACGKDESTTTNLPESTVDLGNVDATVRYSADCLNWQDISAESDLFGKTEWASGDVGIVYISIKNKGDSYASFKLTPVLNASLEGAFFGVVENKRSAYANAKSALSDLAEQNIALNENNSHVIALASEDSITLAVVVHIPDEADGGKCGVGLKITASLISNASNENAAVRQNGKLFVSCSDKSIEITEIQPEGSKPMSAKQFLNGNQNLDGCLVDKND
jgi:hypothetical protein